MEVLRAVRRACVPWRDVGEWKGRPADWWREAAEEMLDGEWRIRGSKTRARVAGTAVREMHAMMMKGIYERVWLRRCKSQVERERAMGVRRIWRSRRDGEQLDPVGTDDLQGNQRQDGNLGRRKGMPLPGRDDETLVVENVSSGEGYASGA
ncbi:hypothetical protein BJ684DRAFT_16261 [Piptocephalis cylindrospora]|uniref:Uncharacterized protein n=1 Tax=Piptocephalis cylindrospora TaxID=1907219 RepID=A0A4P9Y676_9FUNG|nr:hypothetical protein BJ684DRAFT_16261 [Piptocephalis cylindrospora]|eukprot:RKP13330.1 hypothetical protein BJ684DRAFT_16261 [Piptocephalis cylindrospora]